MHACIVIVLYWSQNCNVINRLVLLLKKILELLILNHVTLTLLFKKSFSLKFLDKVNLENTLLVNKSINSINPLIQKTLYVSINPSIIFYLLFSMTDSYSHLTNTINYQTSWSFLSNLHKPSYKTNMPFLQSAGVLHSLTHSLTRSLTHSLFHSLTHTFSFSDNISLIYGL